MPAPLSANPEDAAAAALFSRLLRTGGWTHEKFAAEIGVSAGRVSQWATNRGAIPPERAVAVARLLGSSPALLSPVWGRLRDEWAASQPERQTEENMAQGLELLNLLADARPEDRRFKRPTWAMIQIAAKAVERADGSPREAMAEILAELPEER
jgi:DNA-binding transcriptional regulator YdaS (Cro superfamily)